MSGVRGEIPRQNDHPHHLSAIAAHREVMAVVMQLLLLLPTVMQLHVLVVIFVEEAPQEKTRQHHVTSFHVATVTMETNVIGITLRSVEIGKTDVFVQQVTRNVNLGITIMVIKTKNGQYIHYGH